MTSSPVTVYHLEMLERATFRPSAARPDFEVVAIDPPDPELNRKFYCAVGSQWKWTDRLAWSEEDWLAYVKRDVVSTYVGRLEENDVGYFELEAQEPGNVEIIYFGLLPQFIGKGLGSSLLSAAVERAWALPGTRRVWAHTCTHDHKHALNNYRARGLELFKTTSENPTSATDSKAAR